MVVNFIDPYTLFKISCYRLAAITMLQQFWSANYSCDLWIITILIYWIDTFVSMNVYKSKVEIAAIAAEAIHQTLHYLGYSLPYSVITYG